MNDREYSLMRLVTLLTSDKKAVPGVLIGDNVLNLATADEVIDGKPMPKAQRAARKGR
jgi:hypothetical protein